MRPRIWGLALGTAHHIRVAAFIVALLWDDWRHHPTWPE